MDAFLEWKRKASPQLPFGEALEKYEQKLRADGLSQAASERTIPLIVAYDEAELYNRVYAAPPEFNTNPNQFLVGTSPDSTLRRSASRRRERRPLPRSEDPFRARVG